MLCVQELSLLGLDVSDADDFLPLRENQWTERECSHLVFGAALASENDSWSILISEIVG